MRPSSSHSYTRGYSRGMWLLLAFLLGFAAFFTEPLQRQSDATQALPRTTTLISRQPPEVVAPTGQLNTIYKNSRPATLRIETRAGGNFMNFVEGIGTGFFISETGQVLTAYHVVERSSSDNLVAVDAEDNEYALELIGFDAYLDLALLQADIASPVSFLPLNDAAVEVGTDIVAIGNSRGDVLEARAGQVTRLGVEASRADFASGTIELTASLAPGDSGGPVLNDLGEVIGVVSYISFMPGSEDAFVPPFLRDLGLIREFASYAVPVTHSGDVLARLVAGDQRDVPVIGFELYDDYVPRSSDRQLGPLAGPIIRRVQPGSPAEAAGLRSLRERVIRDATNGIAGRRIEADVIVAVNDERTRNFNELLASIRSKRIGDSIILQVQRGNETVFLELKLGAKAQVFQ
ncbi:MAG: S1C family serine protease [Deinococcota bacterium]